MSSEVRSAPGAGHVGPLLVARCIGCEKTSEKRTTEIVGDRSSGSFQHVCHTCQLVTWWNVLEVVDDDQDDEPELVTDGGLEQYTESDRPGDNIESGMREAVAHPGIDGTWHHYGALEWWEPDKLYDSEHARPICPVKHCASGEDHECRTICTRCNVDEQIKPEFVDTDRPVGGAWYCVMHGWFRVHDYPRESDSESEQVKLVTDGGVDQEEVLNEHVAGGSGRRDGSILEVEDHLCCKKCGIGIPWDAALLHGFDLCPDCYLGMHRERVLSAFGTTDALEAVPLHGSREADGGRSE